MEEFDIMQNIQEDRMAHHAALKCHERCVTNYWFRHFYLGERTCMENCLKKINQATIIVNLNYGKFSEMEQHKGKK